MNNTGKIFTALVAGVAAGVILGVLFAPDKGTETRKKINKKGKQFADDLKDKYNKGKEKFRDMKEEMEQTFNEKVKDFN